MIHHLSQASSSPYDIDGHNWIGEEPKPHNILVATGEHCPNKAVDIVQIDHTVDGTRSDNVFTITAGFALESFTDDSRFPPIGQPRIDVVSRERVHDSPVGMMATAGADD